MGWNIIIGQKFAQQLVPKKWYLGGFSDLLAHMVPSGVQRVEKGAPGCQKAKIWGPGCAQTFHRECISTWQKCRRVISWTGGKILRWESLPRLKRIDRATFGRLGNHENRPEMGRRGSPRAHTLGKRSHEPQDHFKMPPGPPGYNKKFKNSIKHNKTTKNQVNYLYFDISLFSRFGPIRCLGPLLGAFV